MPNIGPPRCAAIILASASPPVISLVDILSPRRVSPLPACGERPTRRRRAGEGLSTPALDRRQPLTLALRARLVPSARAPLPASGERWGSPRLPLVRIEALLQPRPAVDVVRLQRRAFGGIGG